MRHEEIVARLKAAEPVLKEQGVDALYILGPQPEISDDAEVDLFVDPRSGGEFGFLEFMKTYDTLQDAIGRGHPLGYSTRDGLSPYLLCLVEREAVRVF